MKTLLAYILVACGVVAALGVGAGIAALLPAPARTDLSAQALKSYADNALKETAIAETQTQHSPVSSQTRKPSPGKDFAPQAVHTGDVVDDALAYAKQLIPFLRTHVLNGRVQEEKVGSLFRLLYKGASDTGHDNDLEYFIDIVTRELEKAGVCDKYGNQPIQ